MLSAHLLDGGRLHLRLLQVEDLHGLEGGQLARPGHGLGALQGAGSRIYGNAAMADGTGGYRKDNTRERSVQGEAMEEVYRCILKTALRAGTPFFSRKYKNREARK